jgi:cytochrome c biogenesis protein CcdA/glutaredoxin
MKSKIVFIGIIVLAFVLIFYINLNPVSSESNTGDNEVTIAVFYGQGCPHCAKLESFLDDLSEQKSNIHVLKYETYFNRDNRELFAQLSKVYDSPIRGVPTTFIGDKVIVGFSNSIKETLEQEIRKCELDSCINPLEKVGDGGTQIIGDSSPTEDPGQTAFKRTVTIPAVIGAALVDAINPCAFAVLIILLTTILAASHRRKALLAGLAFTLAIFISYFLMGLGLYSAIQASGLTHIFFVIVAILAILVGLFNMKDYLWYGKWFVMEVPMKWRPRMKSLLRGVTSVPGAFFIGFVISLFLLPCTSGPYIAILGLLAQAVTRDYAIMLLFLYNLIFILPMLIITLAIYWGIATTEQAERWRTRRLRILHLISGLIIFVLGVGMVIALIMGWV